MEHLGASLPLRKQAAATDKAVAKLDSVKQCWEEGEDIPIQVLVQQFQAQVLGALRHQQQAARLPHEWEEERRKEFEGLIRKRIRLGASLPSAYLQAPPPGGLGLGNISLQGAVDFLAGSGQLRYAPNEVKASVLQEIEQQAIQEGICPCTLVPQHGPWEKGRQTILQDLLRSLDEVGAIALMGGERRCRRKGPVIARAGYGPRRQRDMRGVQRSEWGDNAWLEVWAGLGTKIPVLRAPHVVVKWLIQMDTRHLGDMVRMERGRVVWKDWVLDRLRASDMGEGSEDSDKTRTDQEADKADQTRKWILSVSAEDRWGPRKELTKLVDWVHLEFPLGSAHNNWQDKGMEPEAFVKEDPDTDSLHPMRRIYPHFVRSDAKEALVSLQGAGLVAYGGRRSQFINATVAPELNVKQRWAKLSQVHRSPEECWGV